MQAGMRCGRHRRSSTDAVGTDGKKQIEQKEQHGSAAAAVAANAGVGGGGGALDVGVDQVALGERELALEAADLLLMRVELLCRCVLGARELASQLPHLAL